MSEENSNFHQLLKLQAQENPEIIEWLRRFFTIMADETADVSNKEQLVICIRWVDDCFVIQEDLIGMHPSKRTNADQVVAILMPY